MKTFNNEVKAKARWCLEGHQGQMGGQTRKKSETQTATFSISEGGGGGAVWWFPLLLFENLLFALPFLCFSMRMVGNGCLDPQLLSCIRKEIRQPVEAS